MMASDWPAQVAAKPIGNKKGHDSFTQANSPDIAARNNQIGHLRSYNLSTINRI